jgi:hypothetical protein
MAINLAALDEHLKRIMEDIPVTFDVYGSAAGVQGVRSTPNLTETVIIGGEDEKVEYQIFARRSDLGGVIPTVGTRVDVYDPEGAITKMRVLGVRPSPDDAQLVALQLGFSRER